MKAKRQTEAVLNWAKLLDGIWVTSKWPRMRIDARGATPTYQPENDSTLKPSSRVEANAPASLSGDTYRQGVKSSDRPRTALPPARRSRSYSVFTSDLLSTF